MDTIMNIAKRHHLKVIEDAAQGFASYYKGKSLGTIGDFGCLSFHETKNLSMGEGGALFFQNNAYQEKQRFCVRREQTAVNFSVDRLISIPGRIMVLPIFQAI